MMSQGGVLHRYRYPSPTDRALDELLFPQEQCVILLLLDFIEQWASGSRNCPFSSETADDTN